MSKPINAFMNWSGGKDSALALHYLLKEEIDVRYLLTTINESNNSISMHGVRESMLSAQVKQLKIPSLHLRLPDMPDMASYDAKMGNQLSKFKSEGISHAIYGDIFLEDLKIYREQQLKRCGMHAIFPLWRRRTSALVRELIDLGYQTVVICAEEKLREFCGRVIDHDFLNDLPIGVDPCGENGEFHTFVFDGPIFSQPVNFRLGDQELRQYSKPGSSNESLRFWYQDILYISQKSALYLRKNTKPPIYLAKKHVEI